MMTVVIRKRKTCNILFTHTYKYIMLIYDKIRTTTDKKSSSRNTKQVYIYISELDNMFKRNKHNTIQEQNKNTQT